LKRTIFGRRTPDAQAPERSDPSTAPSANPTETSGRVVLRSSPDGPRLVRSRAYDLGPHTTLVHLTFEDTIEVIELLPAADGLTFGARLWDRGGWPLEAHVTLPHIQRPATIVLKDSNGKHAYFTVIAENPKGRAEYPLDVSEADPA